MVAESKPKAEQAISEISTSAPELATLEAEPEPLEIDLRRLSIMVIDMQNAFISKGGMWDLRGYDLSPAQRIIETISKINSVARAKGVKVIYIAHTLSPDLRETGGRGSAYWHKAQYIREYREQPKIRDKLIIRGTWGAEIIDELEPQEGDILVEKPKYSAFYGTDLDTILKTFGIKYLVFVGTATNGCVEASLRDALYLGYFCILISDATAAAGPPFMQDATISNVKLAYGWVTTSQDIIKAMK